MAADLMLFRKSLLTLEGVIGELGADDFQIDSVVLGEFARHFGQEWLNRWISPPASRAFATRISNADLAETLLNAPIAVTRFWFAELADLSTPCAASLEIWALNSRNAATVAGRSCR